MDNQTKKNIINFLGIALVAYNAYLYPRIFILLFLPIIIFACLHYLILQKSLNVQFPLRPFSSKLTKWFKVNLEKFPNYDRHVDDAGIFYFITLFPVTFILAGITDIPSLLSSYINIIGEKGSFLLFYTVTATILLLAFSHFFLAKPLKETWRAIVLAGIIAGAATVALHAGLEKFVEPHLPVRTGKVQPTTEYFTPNS